MGWRHLLPAGVALVSACAAVSLTRDPIGVDALVADAPAYVAQRYRSSELPSALIADLTAAGFQCQHSATSAECGRADHAFASCFDVYTVQVEASAVRAEKSRRCMGAQP